MRVASKSRGIEIDNLLREDHMQKPQVNMLKKRFIVIAVQ